MPRSRQRRRRPILAHFSPAQLGRHRCHAWCGSSRCHSRPGRCCRRTGKHTAGRLGHDCVRLCRLLPCRLRIWPRRGCIRCPCCQGAGGSKSLPRPGPPVGCSGSGAARKQQSVLALVRGRQRQACPLRSRFHRRLNPAARKARQASVSARIREGLEQYNHASAGKPLHGSRIATAGWAAIFLAPRRQQLGCRPLPHLGATTASCPASRRRRSAATAAGPPTCLLTAASRVAGSTGGSTHPAAALAAAASSAARRCTERSATSPDSVAGDSGASPAAVTGCRPAKSSDAAGCACIGAAPAAAGCPAWSAAECISSAAAARAAIPSANATRAGVQGQAGGCTTSRCVVPSSTLLLKLPPWLATSPARLLPA